MGMIKRLWRGMARSRGREVVGGVQQNAPIGSADVDGARDRDQWEKKEGCLAWLRRQQVQLSHLPVTPALRTHAAVRRPI
jgi:hypothetical protein